MPDRFARHATSLDAPAGDGFSITPNDATPLVQTTRAIYVGTPGDIALTLLSGAEIILRNAASGSLLPLRATHVRATGTTASDLVGLL